MKTDGNDGSLLHDTTSLGRYMSVAGLSERVVVGERSAIPIPDGIALGAACAVGCGVTTGFGAAVITGGVRWGESVAVFGCGAVGLSAIQGARTVGASRIIGVDPNRERLDLALKLGATDVLSPEESDPVSAIQVMTDGGVDLAVECVGSADIIRQAFDAISPGGRAVAVGLTSHADHVSIPVVSLLLGKSLHGSIHGSADPVRDFPKLYRLIEGGSLELDSMLGPDYSLDAVNEAMEALSSGRSVRPRVLMKDAG
jgi:S-(hydroxymethyl)glutathione dehydrogenase/alcohol dehydrogenase